MLDITCIFLLFVNAERLTCALVEMMNALPVIPLTSLASYEHSILLIQT